MATALGFGSELAEKGQGVECDKPMFYGSFSRDGLFAGGMFDKMYDYAFDFRSTAAYAFVALLV